MWYRAPWWAGIAEICEIDLYKRISYIYIYIYIAMKFVSEWQLDHTLASTL